MSGICGFFARNGASIARQVIQRMTNAMTCRGPDGSGVWCQGVLGLGHRMLHDTPESVVERLPLLSRSGELAITADARLDNRSELGWALGLERGQLRELADATLILRAYEAWGDGCLARLEGDFAFAIWDGRARRLLCARDPFGVKPFYYFLSAESFAFASDIAALRHAPGVRFRPNEERIADYLGIELLEGSDKTSTFYRDILRLQPAHVLAVGLDLTFQRTYWSLDPTREHRFGSEEDCLDAFRDVFTEAVRRRMRGAGRVGSMLSGGLDSSSIVCVASALQGAGSQRPLPTFSALSQDEAACPEARFVRAMLRGEGLEPHLIKPDEIAALLPDVLAHLEASEDPFDYGAVDIPLLMYGQARRTGVRVLLDGVDGDLVTSQGAYALLYAFAEGRWSTAWRHAGGLAGFYGGSQAAYFLRQGLWPTVWLRLLRPQVPEFVLSLRRIYRRRRRYATWLKESLVHRGFAEKIDLRARMESLPTLDDKPPDPCKRSPREDHRRLLDWAVIPAALERYGRAAAFQSVEARHPFLDRCLVEFCLALSWEDKTRDGWPKSILRRSLAGQLPEEVRTRAWAPLDLNSLFRRVIISLARPWIDDQLGRMTEIEEYVDSLAVRRMQQDCSAGRLDEADKMLKVATLAAWLSRARAASIERPA